MTLFTHPFRVHFFSLDFFYILAEKPLKRHPSSRFSFLKKEIATAHTKRLHQSLYSFLAQPPVLPFLISRIQAGV
jgi:hypothetical protein